GPGVFSWLVRAGGTAHRLSARTKGDAGESSIGNHRRGRGRRWHWTSVVAALGRWRDRPDGVDADESGGRGRQARAGYAHRSQRHFARARAAHRRILEEASGLFQIRDRSRKELLGAR